MKDVFICFITVATSSGRAASNRCLLKNQNQTISELSFIAIILDSRRKVGETVVAVAMGKDVVLLDLLFEAGIQNYKH